MACAQLPSYECPVCWEDCLDPKILPCAHLLCQTCVLYWLEQQGREAPCPLCQASILSSDGSYEEDPVSAVEALPTDLHTAALVESRRQILQWLRICSLCEDDVAACSYCVQCNIYLCTHCAKGHGKIPVTSAHTLADLCNLSVEKLAAIRPVTCKVHPSIQAKVFCPAHREVICVLCDTTSHAACADKMAVTDMAITVRTDLDQRFQKLKLRERELAEQVVAAEENFKILRSLSQDLLENLPELMEEGERNFIEQIYSNPELIRTMLVPALVKKRDAFTQNVTMIERLARRASDGVLLQMFWKLTEHLDDLEKRAAKQCRKAALLGAFVDGNTWGCLRSQADVPDLPELELLHSPEQAPE